jgi:hypothetical protein
LWRRFASERDIRTLASAKIDATRCEDLLARRSI